jgi:hypothetical protein
LAQSLPREIHFHISVLIQQATFAFSGRLFRETPRPLGILVRDLVALLSSMAFDRESGCSICAFTCSGPLLVLAVVEFFDLADLCITNDDIVPFGHGRLEQGWQLDQSGFGFGLLCKASTDCLCCYPPSIDQQYIGCESSRPEDVAVRHQRFHRPATILGHCGIRARSLLGVPCLASRLTDPPL